MEKERLKKEINENIKKKELEEKQKQTYTAMMSRMRFQNEYRDPVSGERENSMQKRARENGW